MDQLAYREIDVAPRASGPVSIDRAHLSQMTLGDRTLEREVLELFDRQAEMLVARMDKVASACVPPLAHTLKGSARGIGAWDVATAAEALELADGSAVEFEAAKRRLAGAVRNARKAIAELLRAH
ncbi:MAG TPA: Hpt domain-containing protein [Pseudolabrys sp.]|jgi:HPt (histidine-containing phosphotransfer) domain-containing protein|nr:Hpt domain-containing protein [Pseudolabrys sp.]